MRLCMIYDIDFGQSVAPEIIVYEPKPGVGLLDTFTKEIGSIPLSWNLESFEV